MTINPRRQTGVTLIEMMIAQVVGLIIAGSTLSFVMAGVRSNTEFVSTTRLTQELRGLMDVSTRELRRAGFDQNAYRTIGAGTTYTSPFASMQFVPTPTAGNTVASCVVLAYDSAVTTAGSGPGVLGSTERRGIRYNAANRSVEFNFGTGATPDCAAAGANYAVYPPACNAATGWCALTNPQQMEITRFELDTKDSKSIAPVGTTTPGVAIRVVTLTVAGNLPGNNQVVRTLVNEVRVRSDCTLANCTAAP
ncbi:PilW family protein [Tahibacter amnicola]|uniref:Prepilin-type N-terminal cleavage/methylation domain-containing protein n=1 Tax=Tahibacter amnicola TaxID=2976241 RepID=A0ABY6BJN9_9GAMM|nr:prepilin-type N-terminal cleavage/methylation domain-containing protein [Tahibacter amnicola]UXI69682.1 prepilin-type N-terminal cleavage/methylation domain-containing protein [Tahibacter amnicola]